MRVPVEENRPSMIRKRTYLYKQYVVLSEKQFVVLSHVAALDALNYFAAYANLYPIDYYAKEDAGIENTVFHKVKDFREIGYVFFDGVCCTDASRTFNDMMQNADEIDDSVILDAMGTYYYTHGCSFDSLRIDYRYKETFDSFIDDAIHYYVQG